MTNAAQVLGEQYLYQFQDEEDQLGYAINSVIMLSEQAIDLEGNPGFEKQTEAQEEKNISDHVDKEKNGDIQTIKTPTDQVDTALMNQMEDLTQFLKELLQLFPVPVGKMALEQVIFEPAPI